MTTMKTARAFAVGAALLALPGMAGPPTSAATSAATAADSVTAVADDVEAFLSSRTRPDGFAAPLSGADDAALRGWSERLARIDPTTLTGTDAHILRALLVEMIEETRQMERCPPRTEPGPVGASCYEAWLRLMTSLPLTAREVYDLGVRMRADLEAEIVPLARATLGVDNSVAARALLVEDERYRFPSRDAMREASVRYLAQAKAAMPRLVRIVPDDSLELVVMDEAQGRGFAAAGFYNPESDGEPARFFLNTTQSDARPRSTSSTAAFHEGWPGHHFQSARHMHRTPAHPVYGRVFAAAFVEGWGLYSEQLADELGLYDSSEDRIGYLLHMQDAIVALQVDAGLHAFGWTREQAIDTMMLVGGRPRGQAEQYADRHLATPAQMISYMIGMRKILELRAEAQRRLGSRYDVRDFHEALLAPGALPLSIVESEVRAWIGR